MLVVLDRLIEPDPHLVAQLLDRCPELGISVLWLSDSADRVPPQCRVVAELADRTEVGAEQLSRLWFTDPETPTEWFSADGVDRTLPDLVARSLAPLRDASSTTSTSSIPRIVPLFAAHGIDEVTPGWIQQEWAVDRRGDGGYALETVVGTTADGPLRLDLVADGPHGLIGGTSGAGKSELIQSLVAGLVAYQSPRDLSLLFIDFKGGSASEVFKDLPHVSGRVTDLDESLALRAQVSLRAELRRRVTLFSEFAAKDMAEMRRLHPEHAPPSLVIVIDEFATLVKQLPDFVADIIDIAQRGRSYGVHLILATQRPSASVDDNILANTNLRISLRMLDRAESMSILNAPDAAEIPVPLKGRSIARLGPGQLVEFQSAYCSAPLATTGGRPPVALTRPRGERHRSAPPPSAHPASPATPSPTPSSTRSWPPSASWAIRRCARSGTSCSPSTCPSPRPTRCAACPATSAPRAVSCCSAWPTTRPTRPSTRAWSICRAAAGCSCSAPAGRARPPCCGPPRAAPHSTTSGPAAAPWRCSSSTSPPGSSARSRRCPSARASARSTTWRRRPGSSRPSTPRSPAGRRRRRPRPASAAAAAPRCSSWSTATRTSWTRCRTRVAARSSRRTSGSRSSTGSCSTAVSRACTR